MPSMGYGSLLATYSMSGSIFCNLLSLSPIYSDQRWGQYCGHESLEMFLTKSFKMLRQNLISLYIGIWNVFPQVHRSSIFEIVWENLKSNDSYSCLSYFCGMSVNMTKSWFNQKTPYFLTAEMSHRNKVKHKRCQLTWLLLRGEVENISPDKKHPGVSFRRLAVFETKRSTTFENKEK